MMNKPLLKNNGVIFIRKILTVILAGVFLFTNTSGWAKEERLFSTGIEDKPFSFHPVDNNKLAPESRLHSEEFKYSLTVAAICKHIEHDGNLDDRSYLNDVLARLGAEKSSNITVLPYEIIIEIPNERLAIRYFDPTKANVITPYSEISKLETKVIGARLNRQIIRRTKVLQASNVAAAQKVPLNDQQVDTERTVPHEYNERNIILDIDGVIVDPAIIRRRVAIATYCKIFKGIPPEENVIFDDKTLENATNFFDDHKHQMMAKNIPEAIKKAVEYGVKIQDDETKLIERYSKDYSVNRIAETEKLLIEDPDKLLMPGVREFIMREHKNGKKLFITSASAFDLGFKILKATGLSQYFEKIYVSPSVEAKVSAMSKIITEFNLDLKDVVFFDDGPHVVAEARKQLGDQLHIVGVTAIDKDKRKMSALGVKDFIGSLRDLIPGIEDIDYFVNKGIIVPSKNEAPDSIRDRLIKMFLPIRAIEVDKNLVMDGYVPGPYLQKEIKNTSEDEANSTFRNRMIESEIGLLCNLNPERKPDKESLIREAKEILNNVLSLRINEQNIFVDTITNAESNIIVMQCIKLVFFNNIYYDQYNPYANVNEAVNAILARRLTERGSLMSYTELLKEAVSSVQAKFFFQEKRYRTEDAGIAYHEICGRIEQENSQKAFDSVNAIQGFLEEIKKGEKAVTYIVDDNGEVVYHLYLIQKYLEDNTVLKITLIPRAGQYREDASYEDVARLLKQPLFSKLAGYMETNRFKIVKNGPLLSGIDLARMSDETRRAIETCDFIFSVGCVNFEMLNGVKKDSYQIIMVYSTPSQLCTGNKKGDYLFRHFKAGERYLKPIKLAKIENASKKDAFIKGQMDYSYKNKPLFKDMLGEDKPDALIRVPVEAIESVGIDNIKDFLATFQEAPNGYVELYYMSGMGEINEKIYQKYGLQKKSLPKDFKRKRENTITLFPALKGEEINQSTIVSRLGSFDITPDNTILSPIGLQHDPAGLIRATILGLKMMDIARQIKEKGIGITNQAFRDKIQLEILEQLKNVCDADDLKNFNLTPDDIIAIAAGTINNIITALKKLINLLPITPINAEELRRIYERVKEVITAA